MSAMKLPTNLVRRGSRFYYRGRVPEDLKQHFGKTEFFISLKTSDFRAANYSLAHIKAKMFTNFALLRNLDFKHLPTSDIEFRIAPKQPQSNQEPPKYAALTLLDLNKYWASQSLKRPRTLMEAETARKRLEMVAGHNDAHRIEKQHAIILKDKLLAQGLAVQTIQKQINLLKAAFEVAVTNDMISVNPFLGIKLVKPKANQKSRVPFSANDLKIIFHCPLFTQGLRPIGGASEAAVWLPRIAQWTGMRLEEIGQLLVSDIRVEKEINFINVEADTNSGKRLKTISSNRRVPIHPELINAGFLDYVQQIRTTETKRLFPNLKSEGSRQLTASWSQWFSRYLRTEVGINDPRKTFHSFRHGFKEACRISGIPKDIHDQLTGHVSSDVGDGYGGDQYPLQPLNVAIAKIQFDFDKLKTPDLNNDLEFSALPP